MVSIISFTVMDQIKKVLVIGAAGLLIFVLTATIFFGVRQGYKPDKIRTVTIPEGASTKEIAYLLQGEKVIRDPLFFRFLTRISHMDNKLQAGDYEFPSGMSIMQVMTKIARGETVTYYFTIPEGFTVEQIAALLAEKGLVDRERFLQLARTGLPGFAFMNNNPAANYAVEGFLFPDTYNIPRGMKEEDILSMMLTKFNNIVTEEVQEQAAGEGLDMSKLVTLASLVEREAKAPEERPVIAAVFLQRLHIDMPIQSCATIQYILGTPKKELSIQDTQIESAYNTYMHAGLPPGPIANPGLASIQAVLNPAQTDVLYFVAKPDGTHIFSRTYEEHLQAIEQANSVQEKQI